MTNTTVYVEAGPLSLDGGFLSGTQVDTSPALIHSSVL